MNKIDLIDHDSGLKYSIESIKKFCSSLLKELEIDNWEFSVMFCNDDYIAELNEKYRGKQGPTDVLSFCDNDVEGSWAENPDEGQFYAGDIIISVDSLIKNAASFKVNTAEELKRLLIHGILHLNGMDHTTNNPDEEMLLMQEKILNNFGDFKF